MNASSGTAATRILSPTAILGYGFPVSSLSAAMSRTPEVIAVDAGSTDPGPYYLGSGRCFTDAKAVRRDLRLLLEAARTLGIPLLIGSAGGSGGEPHLERDRRLVLDIARESGLHFRLAVIHAEIDGQRVMRDLAAGRVEGCGRVPALTRESVEASVRIVGQMGHEPFLRALEAGAEVVLAGRAYDPGVFAALPLMKGCERGPAVHLGKILECGAIAASPGSGSDGLFGRLDGDSFEVEPLDPGRRCTVESVAAHTLYEKSDPVVLPGPGGSLDLRGTTFRQVDERRVRVTGSAFVPASSYCVKLEGAALTGYRTVAIAGCRDPHMIAAIDEVTALVTERVHDNLGTDAEECHLAFRLYGRDGVMGTMEPSRGHEPVELGVVIDVVAPTQEQADMVCALARSTMLHCSYPGRIATAGNLAFPYSPSDLRAGEVYRFSVYHLLEVDDPCELFPIDWIEV